MVQHDLYGIKPKTKKSSIHSPAYLKWREQMKLIFGSDVFSKNNQ